MSSITWLLVSVCLSAVVYDVARGITWPWSSNSEPSKPRCPEECECESAVFHCAHRKLKAPPKGRWPDVWILHLENNSIQWLAHDALVGFPQLREIHLCMNKLVELDLNVFGFGTPLLASLYATENIIDSVSGAMSRKLPLLSRIDLSRNRLHVPPSLDAISLAAPSLLELYLSGNPLNNTGSNAMMSMGKSPLPVPVVSYIPTLRVLDVSAANLKNLTPHSLIGVPSVESLNLANNTMVTLGTAIRNMRQLTELDLSYNNLTKIEPHTLPKFHRLQYLWLVGNPIEYVNPNILKESLAEEATVDACGTIAACTDGLNDLYAWARERLVRVYGDCDDNATRPGTRVARSIGQGGFSW